MNLFVIKIGKAISAVKNDGVLRAGRKIASGVWSVIRPVGRGEVLLVSGGIGDSARYRTKHVAEFLSLHGFRARYATQDHLGIEGIIKKFPVVVLHRVMMTRGMKRVFEGMKRRGQSIIFETDDLVFDVDMFRHMAILENMNVFERRQYEKGVGADVLSDSYVKTATASTSFLKEILEQRKKEVFLVPNLLSQQDVKHARKIVHKQLRTELPSEHVRIGYFSGTKSHDKDFASVSDVLVRILSSYSHTRLVIAGPLALEEKFSQFSDRIERLSFASRKKHFENIARTDINIAPLEMKNPFCEAKSELKWFEAGVVGVPTVASATKTFQDAIEHGEDGFVAQNEEQWYTACSRMVEDAALRRRVGERARNVVMKHWTTTVDVGDQYLEYIRKNVSQSQ